MHSWTPGSTCPRPAPAAAPVSRPGAPPRGYPGNKSQTILENPGWLASGHISHEEEEYLLSAGLPQKGTLAPVVPAGFFLLPVPSAEPRMRPPPPPRGTEPSTSAHCQGNYVGRPWSERRGAQ